MNIINSSIRKLLVYEKSEQGFSNQVKISRANLITQIGRSSLNNPSCDQTENYTNLMKELDANQLEGMLKKAIALEEVINDQPNPLLGCDISFEDNLKLCFQIKEFNQLLNDIHQEKKRLGSIVHQIAASSLNLKIEEIEAPLQVDDAPFIQALIARTSQLDEKDLFHYLTENAGKNEDILFEIAKLAASLNGEAISEHIHEYGIKDQNKLFEIAKLAAFKGAPRTGGGIWNISVHSKLRD